MKKYFTCSIILAILLQHYSSKTRTLAHPESRARKRKIRKGFRQYWSIHCYG